MSKTKAEKQTFYDSLCDLEIPSTIKLSPDARQVLYSTNLTWNHRKGKHPVSTLWLAETGRPGSSKQITSGSFKDHSPRWCPDGSNKIAFISDRAEAGKKWAIYLLNLQDGQADGEPYPITDPGNEREISVIEFSPDGSRIAYIAADEKTPEEKAREEAGDDPQVWGEQWTFARLRIVDCITKEVRRVTGSFDPKQAERHVKGFSWSPDGKKIAVLNARTPHIEEPWYTGDDISILTLGGQFIEDCCKVPNEVSGLTWAADGNLYFQSGTMERKLCGGNSLWIVPPETDRKDPLKGPAKRQRVNGFGEFNDLDSVQKINGDVVLKVQHNLEYQIVLSTGKVLYSAAKDLQAFDAGYTTDSDEIVLALATSDINTPVEVYTTTASGGGLVQLSNHGAAFTSTTFGTCTPLSTPSHDDEVTIDSLLLSPTSEPPSTPQPTLVLIHGGPSNRHTNAFNAHYYFWTPYLLSLGYTVLVPNYRGSTGKGTTFASYSTRGQGQGDYEDIITSTQNAVEMGYADKNRLIVGGVSQGAFLSYLASVKNGMHGHGWKFQAAIPVSGVCNTDAMALTSDLGGTLEPELCGGRAPWSVDISNTQNRSASALWQFHAASERSKKSGEMFVPPMLILHGEKDPRCPVSQAVGFRRALVSRGLPFEMVVYPRQEHLFEERTFWRDMMGRVDSWVERYIGKGERVGG
ncbi:hypothetical protein PRZ48_007510 [Zasmidium cellare]|uniref:Dipeptidyl-peptidase V n=1 Tax=Zasmidium cellare TaxID=395010 RepID=A0ABR0EK91_ZASCE|nr:hypothetical protein PRZ48_007510 [Zasmidium cellare]